MRNDKNRLEVEDVTQRQALPAGDFSAWLGDTRRTLIEHDGAAVPCGPCNACCKSSYFIHIAPDELETLRRIPRALRFPAPGLPNGNVVLGFNEHGHCPMLIDEACSIYEHRPQTCRDYDCRVFPAAGIDAGGNDKAAVNRRIARWKFSYPSQPDQRAHQAVNAAAKFLRAHAADFPEGIVPRNPAQLAILAIKVYEVFVEVAQGTDLPPYRSHEIVQAVIDKLRQFDAQCRQ